MRSRSFKFFPVEQNTSQSHACNSSLQWRTAASTKDRRCVKSGACLLFSSTFMWLYMVNLSCFPVMSSSFSKMKPILEHCFFDSLWDSMQMVLGMFAELEKHWELCMAAQGHYLEWEWLPNLNQIRFMLFYRCSLGTFWSHLVFIISPLCHLILHSVVANLLLTLRWLIMQLAIIFMINNPEHWLLINPLFAV